MKHEIVNGSRPLFAIKVESASNPRTFYIVKIYSEGDIACTKENDRNEGCVAYEMGKACRHILAGLGRLQYITLEAYKKYGKVNSQSANAYEKRKTKRNTGLE